MRTTDFGAVLTPTRRVFSAVSLVILLACQGESVIIEDWGPPVGFTTVVGTVRRADLSPAFGVSLSFRACSAPLGGFLGSARTDTQGRYRLDATLPPAMTVNADTVRIRCEVRTGSPFAVLDSVDIRFWRAQSAVVPIVADFTFPL